MSSTKKKRSSRRQTYAPEFKADVVRMCQSSGESIPKLCKRLGLTETTVRNWVRKAEASSSGGGGVDALTRSEREELVHLRRETKRLKMEREILKKAATFFAKESS